jgi:protein NEDD1
MNVAFSACGSEVKLWDGASCLATFAHERPRCALNRCAYNRSGELLACSFSDGAVSFLSIKSGLPSTAPLFHVTQPGDNITCLSFNQAGDALYSGTDTGNVTVWSTAQRSVVRRHALSSSPLVDLSAACDDAHVAVADSSGNLHIVNAATHAPPTSFKVSDCDLNAARFSPFQRRVVVTCDDGGAVGAWDVSRGDRVASLTPHKSPATGLSFSPLNELLLVTCGLDKRILFHDLKSHKMVKSLPTEQPLTSIAFGDNNTVIAGTSQGRLLL